MFRKWQSAVQQRPRTIRMGHSKNVYENDAQSLNALRHVLQGNHLGVRNMNSVHKDLLGQPMQRKLAHQVIWCQADCGGLPSPATPRIMLRRDISPLNHISAPSGSLNRDSAHLEPLAAKTVAWPGGL